MPNFVEIWYIDALWVPARHGIGKIYLRSK